MLSAAALPGGGAPLRPGADEARRAAQQELSGQVYRDARPGLVQQLWEELLGLLDRLPAPSGGPAVQAVVVVVLVVAVLVAALLLVRRTGGATRRAAGVEPGLAGPVSAEALRAAASRAAQEGRHHDAVVDGFRALVRGLQERDLVPSEAGLTAAEAVRAAARELPGLTERLTEAGRLFDGVLYGGRRATAADAEEVAALDAAAASSVGALRPRVAPL